jgi:hypothetical protein
METVVDYIVKSYHFKEADYFLFDYDDENVNDIHILLDKTVKFLTTSIETDFNIIEASINNNNNMISIKFSYKGYLGELYNTCNSRGYEYWCVSFIDA